MPTQASGTTRVFEKATRGLTEYARQPNGMIGMMRGFRPVRTSYKVITRRGGGPAVLLNRSTSCRTASVQKEGPGARLATNLECASSMIDLIACSVTPFSWWMCGGDVAA
eukprot:6183909-Pleurochrysis_carterae.AAC.2